MGNSKSHTSYYCEDKDCLINNEMPRFIVHYQNDSSIPLSKTFYLGGFYVQIDFVNNTTLISRLDVIILLDSVIIHKALDLDLNDKEAAANKLKTLVMFS